MKNTIGRIFTFILFIGVNVAYASVGSDFRGYDKYLAVRENLANEQIPSDIMKKLTESTKDGLKNKLINFTLD